jgi:hypothetical protein
VVNRKRLSLDENLTLPISPPLPDTEMAFGPLVDQYSQAHAITRAETFRRISAVTGNSVNGLSLRYHQKGDQPWRFSGPVWVWRTL